MPIKSELQIQVGKQSDFTTSATATAKLMGVQDISLQPDVKSQVFADMRGNVGPGSLAALLEASGSGKLSTLVCFEEFPYWLDALLGEATPTGAGPYVRDYIGPISAPTLRLQTLYYGAGSNVYKLVGTTPASATIKIETNKEITADLDFVGQKVATGTLAALADRNVTVATGNDVSLFIDSWGGTIGTTALTARSIKAELKLDSKRVLKKGLGSLNPSGYAESRWEAESNQLTLTAEFDAATKAMLDSIIGTSLTQYQVRLKVQRDANSIIQIDFAGTATEAPEIWTDEDGVCMLDFTLSGTNNSTLGNWLKIKSTSSVAVLA